MFAGRLLGPAAENNSAEVWPTGVEHLPADYAERFTKDLRGDTRSELFTSGPHSTRPGVLAQGIE